MQLNSSRPIAGLAATLFLFYLVYLLISDSPLKRTERFCEPVFAWTKTGVVAATDVFAPRWSPDVSAKFDAGMASCRLWVWNAFYRDNYEKLRKAAESAATNAQASEGVK